MQSSGNAIFNFTEKTKKMMATNKKERKISASDHTGYETVPLVSCFTK